MKNKWLGPKYGQEGLYLVQYLKKGAHLRRALILFISNAFLPIKLIYAVSKTDEARLIILITE